MTKTIKVFILSKTSISMEYEIGLLAVCVFVKTEDWKIIFPAPESLAWRVAGNERACLPDCCVLVSEKVGKGALVIKRRSSHTCGPDQNTSHASSSANPSTAPSISLWMYIVYIIPQPPELFKLHCSLFDAKNYSAASVKLVPVIHEKTKEVYPLALFVHLRQRIANFIVKIVVFFVR